MDYLQHWRLQRRPFENNRDVRFFYPGREHVEALERLLYLVRDGNMCFGLLTGEIGAGKTMVLHQLCQQLEKERYVTVHLPNGHFDFCDLLREIIAGLERRPGSRVRRSEHQDDSRYQLIARFSDLLESKVIRLGRLLVLMIDEAQQLGEETLIELKNLTNIGTSDQNAITVLLAGQPELSEQVRALPQINQRVGLRYHLPCLSPGAVGDYLAFRLAAAGAEGAPIFEPAAIGEIYEQTEGVPREINRICKLALDRAFTLGERSVSSAVVSSIAEDIYLQDALV
jgi:general secretion pathway protein A